MANGENDAGAAAANTSEEAACCTVRGKKCCVAVGSGLLPPAKVRSGRGQLGGDTGTARRTGCERVTGSATTTLLLGSIMIGAGEDLDFKGTSCTPSGKGG